MPVMKWNTPPKGNADERKAHVVGHGEGVELQHAAFGKLIDGGAQVSSLNPNYDIATKWSSAPYVGYEEVEFGLRTVPNQYGYRDSKRQGKCTANGDTCNGNATHASGLKWCAGHAKQQAKLAEQEE